MNTLNQLREIMYDIENDFLHNLKLDMLSEEYAYFKEAMTLYAKQHNLIKSVALLIDNNMNEEAIVLARSALNNYFLISYLLNDLDGTHYKEYLMQPTITSYFYWCNVNKMMKRPLWERMKNVVSNLSFTKKEVNKNIKEHRKQLKDAGYDLKKIYKLSISTMAESADEHGLGLYATYYAEASKFEHSDISCLDIYKERNMDGKDSIITVNRTNTETKKKTIEMIVISYLESFRMLAEEILVKRPCLKKDFNEDKIIDIMKKSISEIFDSV